jgi:hypothetical protein
MPSSLTTAPAGRGDRAPGARRGDPAAVILSLAPDAPAAGMLRRSTSMLDQARRPPHARVPARSRLVFKSGVVRAG